MQYVKVHRRVKLPKYTYTLLGGFTPEIFEKMIFDAQGPPRGTFFG